MEYKKKPTQWWEDEKIHGWYKRRMKKVKDKAKAMFARKHPQTKKKVKKSTDDE